MEAKFQKLTNAAYNLIEFFPESDPLKNKAKEKVLALMSAFTGSASGGEKQIAEDIDILLGYFEIAKSQGWLSAINCLIISHEYEKVKSQICLKPEIKEESVKSDLTQNLSARQSKILELLDKNEKAQVMDIQTVLPDVTKRTIRRDLDELLKTEKIQRFGEFNQIFYKIRG